MKVVDPNRSKNMEFRKIEIRNGRHERGWVKNVCAIGLSHGFLEPLESTGLVFVHEYAMRLVSTLQRGQVNQVDIDTYNTVTNELFDFWFGFVTAHFSLSLRDDTPYWHDRSSLGVTNLGATLETLRGSTKQGEPYVISTPAYASLCAGMNFIPTTISDVDSWNIYRKSSKSEELSMLWKIREDKNILLKKVVNFLPTHYQYLKENIYFETE